MKLTPIISTHALVKQFGAVRAVNNVDFEVFPGEIRCLIGPNGAGKSTLFKCLTHQYRPTSGSVYFAGADVSALPSFQVARLGIAIKNQIPSVYPNLSVRESIWLALRGQGLSRRRASSKVAATLEEIGFTEEMAGMPVGSLSHAHRQWCELGMLRASAPRLALLDEPTAGMTSSEMLKTVELIKLLNKQATVIVVEHDLDFIARLAQRVTVFHKGEILAEDTMANIQANETVRDVYLGRKKEAGDAHS
ncbi:MULTISPECIES: ATP-binding cassette domain-containing protein [unclassified Burkholderia]|uniref:ATP-binding cassette domain-containing protein n=1 Tax=unclassified Burkholderia TaxID=2613784 RepID=UPI000F576835|nr:MULTISPECIES: ATP-binding cassette domain-containing protein [unclassified Burkholderia]RQR40720.1 ATP-binding cassette domain-containing protein [Burkholderia sp. Bp9142]RQR45388.1 ATP-binding cassette domain-containing protein [Burkholderia sp. Bp9140]